MMLFLSAQSDSLKQPTQNSSVFPQSRHVYLSPGIEDFGTLVFVRELRVGVIYLRVGPASLGVIHQELQRVLASYSENELKQAQIQKDSAMIATLLSPIHRCYPVLTQAQDHHLCSL